MVFKAEKHFSSGTRKFSEIHWSDFWWETQVIIYILYVLGLTYFCSCIINYLVLVRELQIKLPLGATLVPILFGIDQTHCDLLGRRKMYPLYMSIGNILKRTRRTYSRNAFPVIAYFPVLEGTPKETEKGMFRKAKALLYHNCMSWIIRGLIDAGKR